MGAEEDEEAALHISLDGYDTMGIGYMVKGAAIYLMLDG